MALLDFIFRPRPEAAPRPEPVVTAPQRVAEAKVSEAGVVYAMQMVGRAVWTGRDFKAFADEGYRINPIAYRCIQMIAQAAARVDLLLQRGDAEIESHALLDLIARPNPLQGWAQLFEAVYSFLLLTGNAYIEAVGPKGGAPRELWVLRPDRMKVIAGAAGIPQAYEYSVGHQKKRWPVDPITGASEIMHIRTFHPTNDWYGMSPLEPGGRGVDRNNMAAAHDMALLQNGTRPSGAMIFEPVTAGPGGQSTPAPQEVIDAAKKQLEDRAQGPQNAGRPMVLSGKVKWEEMGLSPKDMDFAKGKADSARDICIAFKVPPVLMLEGEGTYANRESGKLELYEESVLPTVDMVLGQLNVWLVPKFGEGLTLVPDLDRIEALEPRRVARRKSVMDLVDGGIIDTEEAREMLDYGTRPDEAVEKVDSAVLRELLAAVQTVGITPLYRYLRSVSLLPMGMTEEQFAQGNLDMIEGDDLAEGGEGGADVPGQNKKGNLHAVA